MSSSVRVLLCTCPRDAAGRIAEGLLKRRLVACVNEIAGVKSRFRWKGELQEEEETLLVLKTEAARVDEVIAALADLHPYDVPELLSLPVEKGLPAYLDWVRDETSDS